MMNILLVGHKGYLGSYLLKKLSYSYKVYTEDNIGIKFDYIINCAAKASLEYCEDHPKESCISNVKLVKSLISEHKQAKIISFSSYYVYDSHILCNELSQTTDKYQYTKHKLESEQIITNSGGVCFRLGKLFGHPNIFKQNKLTEYIIKNDQVNVDTIIFNPTSLLQVMKVIIYELKQCQLVGIYNLSNRGVVSHYNYACFINSVMGHKKTINIVPQNRIFHNYGRFAMSVEKISQCVSLNSWQRDLTDYMENINV